MAKRLYELLELEDNASIYEIKKAYKKLARKYHPDLNNDVDNEKFIEITKAKDILSDPEKKKIYDKYGDKELEKKDNLYIEKVITLSDIYKNKVQDIEVNDYIKCVSCEGTGSNDKKLYECDKCKNIYPCIKGIIFLCDRCKGKKHLIPKKLICEECKGKGTTKQKINIKANLPDNITENNEVIMEYLDRKIIITYNINFPKRYCIYDNYLAYNMNISLAECICGFLKYIKHPNGTIIEISSNNYVNHHNYYIIPKLGFSNNDLLLSFTIDFPEEIIIDENKKINKKNLKYILGGEKSEEKEYDITINLDKMKKKPFGKEEESNCTHQ